MPTFDVPLPEIPPVSGLSVVACMRNEALRLPDFLRHHRGMGVRRFFIVDNMSTDDTSSILRGAPDVVWLPSSLLYSESRAAWNDAICRKYLANKWCLFVDADELFVYDGWPHKSADSLIRELEEEGADALFTPVVEMYSDLPGAQITYSAGESMISCCPWFDSGGYYLLRSREIADTHPTPEFQMYGGPRNRLFMARGEVQGIRGRIIDWLFGLQGGERMDAVSRFLRRRMWRHLMEALPKPLAVMSKVPLVRWQPGLAYHRGPHFLNRRMEMSSGWGCLLHFKYLQDFAERAVENVRRGQHAQGGHYYSVLLGRMEWWLRNSPLYIGSRRFAGVEDLDGARLMRSISQMRTSSEGETNCQPEEPAPRTGASQPSRDAA